MTTCLNEETLQAYFDGELSTVSTAQVIKHLAECDGCADGAFQLERAIELMASAFEDELPDSVPSARLRERIAAALAGDSVSDNRVRPPRGFWPRLFDLPGSWTLSPRGLAYASLGILAVICAIWFGLRSDSLYNNEPKRAEIEVPTPAPDTDDQRELNLIVKGSPAGSEVERPQSDPDKPALTGSRQFQSPKRYAHAKREVPVAPIPNDRDDLDQWIAGTSGAALQIEAGVFDAGMVRHFERAQMLLRSFRNSDTSAKGFASDLAYERRQSKSLLYSNILLRQNAENSGNLPAEEVLGSLEPVLLDIANLPNNPSADEVRSIKERIHKREIIGVLQVYSAPSMIAGYQP